jgi:hypothetical protein
MRPAFLLASGAAMVLLCTSPGRALSFETTCESAKLRAAARYSHCLIRASDVNAGEAEPSEDAIARCDERFDRAFEQGGSRRRLSHPRWRLDVARADRGSGSSHHPESGDHAELHHLERDEHRSMRARQDHERARPRSAGGGVVRFRRDGRHHVLDPGMGWRRLGRQHERGRQGWPRRLCSDHDHPQPAPGSLRHDRTLLLPRPQRDRWCQCGWGMAAPRCW